MVLYEDKSEEIKLLEGRRKYYLPSGYKRKYLPIVISGLCGAICAFTAGMTYMSSRGDTGGSSMVTSGASVHLKNDPVGGAESLGPSMDVLPPTDLEDNVPQSLPLFANMVPKLKDVDAKIEIEDKNKVDHEGWNAEPTGPSFANMVPQYNVFKTTDDGMTTEEGTVVDVGMLQESQAGDEEEGNVTPGEEASQPGGQDDNMNVTEDTESQPEGGIGGGFEPGISAEKPDEGVVQNEEGQSQAEGEDGSDDGVQSGPIAEGETQEAMDIQNESETGNGDVLEQETEQEEDVAESEPPVEGDDDNISEDEIENLINQVLNEEEKEEETASEEENGEENGGGDDIVETEQSETVEGISLDNVVGLESSSEEDGAYIDEEEDTIDDENVDEGEQNVEIENEDIYTEGVEMNPEEDDDDFVELDEPTDTPEDVDGHVEGEGEYLAEEGEEGLPEEEGENLAEEEGENLAEEEGEDSAEGEGEDFAEEGEDFAEEEGEDSAKEGEDFAEEEGEDSAEGEGEYFAEVEGEDSAERENEDVAEEDEDLAEEGEDSAEEDEDLAEEDEDLAEEGEDSPEEENEDLTEEEDEDLAEEEDEDLAEEEDEDPAETTGETQTEENAGDKENSPVILTGTEGGDDSETDEIIGGDDAASENPDEGQNGEGVIGGPGEIPEGGTAGVVILDNGSNSDPIEEDDPDDEMLKEHFTTLVEQFKKDPEIRKLLKGIIADHDEYDVEVAKAYDKLLAEDSILKSLPKRYELRNKRKIGKTFMKGIIAWSKLEDNVKYAEPFGMSIALDNMVFVTGVSSNHFLESQDGIAGIQKVFPHSRILYYDIGLYPAQVVQVKEWCNVIYRKLDLNRYPEHVRKLQTYAFKPLIIKEVLNEHANILWFDASFRPGNGEIQEIYNFAKQYGGIVLGHVSTQNITSATHPGLYKYIPTVKYKLRQITMASAGVLFVRNTPRIYWGIMYWWFLCALEEECIAPKNSQLECLMNEEAATEKPGTYHHCHRFDQSALNVLLANYFQFDRSKYIPKYATRRSLLRTLERRETHEDDLKKCL